MENQQTQIAVLGAKFDSLTDVIDRMENTIGKITVMNERMGELLAVHSEKLSKQDKVDDILFEKLESLRKEVKEEFICVKEGCKRDILMVNDRLKDVEKRVYMAAGAVVLLTFLLPPIVTEVIKGLSSKAKSVTIERVVNLSYESGSRRIHQPFIAKTGQI